MSAAQRFTNVILPARTYTVMQAGSKTWLIKAPHCGHESSMWDVGRIRYKAAGTPKRKGTCPTCGRRAWTALTRTPAS